MHARDQAFEDNDFFDSTVMPCSDLIDPEKSRVVRNIATGQMYSLVPPAYATAFNLLDEPPLGLTLRKTPSLVDLIQLKLAHGDPALSQFPDQEPDIANSGRKSSMPLITPAEKLKASNFPAAILEIGTWKCVSRYEGDLVAKCYYAKRKLVWEVLENGLKSKIEIQWSDITALKATCRDVEPGLLEIQVDRPPLFFKETNPQPRKHTLWQATSDFTDGQATMCKWHYLKFSPGLLKRHYEKLMQCDPRLKSLSEKAISSKGSDCFEQLHKKDDCQQEQKQYQFSQWGENHPIIRFDSGHLPSFSNIQPVVGSAEIQHSGIVPKPEPVESDDKTTEFLSKSSPSTSSAMDSQVQEDSSYTSGQEGFAFFEHTSGSDKVDYKCYTSAADDLLEQLPSHTLFPESAGVQRSSLSTSLTSGDTPLHREMLDEIAYHLFEEPLPASFDEQANDVRLNLMSSLLQKDSNLPASSIAISASFSSMQPSFLSSFQELARYEQRQANQNMSTQCEGKRLPPEGMMKNSLEPTVFQKKKCESTGDLLMNLPHIGSLPQFYEPALHELVTCNELPRSYGESEYELKGHGI
eukprot:c26932_g1_i2 orf=1116-2855(+)